MAGGHAHGKRGVGSKRFGPEDWASLTWDDLDQWAGSRSVSRGRSYQRQGRVRDLAICEDGRLLATVTGGDRYVTAVWREPARRRADSIHSECTCPVGYDGCKHAVAVVAAYVEALADEKAVPAADPDDPRWAALAGRGEEDDYDDEDDVPDEAEDEPERDLEEDSPKPMKRGRARVRSDDKIEQYIRGKSHDELVEFVLSLVKRYPELREEFQERISLAQGDVKRLVAQARREMDKLTSETGWRNSWSGEGYTPDYSRFKHRLERLAELGHADAVVELGREFIRGAAQQVEESHDEGETATEVAGCMPVVFDAVMKSTLPPPQKILFAVDACLEDDYDVVDESAATLLDSPWQPADWSAVAETLKLRLNDMARGAHGGESGDYRRDQLSGWLIQALENAGRKDELLAVYEAEARATASYQRLVNYLIAGRRYGDAERWAKEGIEKTREKLPGIASALADSLCDLARRRKQWDVVAAHAAWKFFDDPAIRTFEELVAHSAKGGHKEEVRAAALRFLETGVSPIRVTQSRNGERALRVDPSWPLPVPDYLVPLLSRRGAAGQSPGPHYDVLLDMAIAEKRPDDVLHWYDKMRAGQKRSTGGWDQWGDSDADRVAEAVAKSHPERSLEVYRRGLEANLSQADLNAYQSASHYLKKMRPIMNSLGRAEEWNSLLTEIREKHRNRPRFMEILDGLEGRRIVDTPKRLGRRR